MAPVAVRVLPVLAGPASWQMAIDSALLERRAAGAAPATVRLYRFDPPALTLGRFERVEAPFLDRARSLGLDVARRPTGGRSVLHVDEITYAFVFSYDDGIAPSVPASYRQLSALLAAALALAGVRVDDARDAPHRAPASLRHAACFALSLGGDLTVGGRKLVGSAQVHRKGAVLQHGSIARSHDSAAYAALYGDDAACAVAANATSLRDLGAADLTEHDLRAALIRALGAAGFDAFEGGLTDEERALAARLERACRAPDGDPAAPARMRAGAAFRSIL